MRHTIHFVLAAMMILLAGLALAKPPQKAPDAIAATGTADTADAIKARLSKETTPSAKTQAKLAAELSSSATKPAADSNAVSATATPAAALTSATKVAASSANQIAASVPASVPATMPSSVPAVSAAPASSPATQPVASAATEPVATVTIAASAPASATIAAVKQARSARATYRFQYEGVRYSDVVRKFTQAAGKPLLPPPDIDGTLTFFDSESYTYDEAFDMLNIILGMRGFILNESDRYFELVPLSQIQQRQLKIIRGSDNTENIRPTEIVSMVIPLKFLDATTAQNAVARMVSTFGSIAALTKGKGVIVTDRLVNIKRVQNLLSGLDTSSISSKQIKTIVLKKASAVSVADTVGKIFAPKGGKRVHDPQTNQYVTVGADTEDVVTAASDERTNMLILMGEGDKLAMAEQMVERLDTTDGPVAGDIRIFELKNAKASDLAETIRAALPSMPRQFPGAEHSYRPTIPGKTIVEARVVADLPTNRLIISAPVDQMVSIEKLVQDLDKACTASNGVKIFRLKVADAQQLSTVVSASMTRRDARGNSSNPIAISADARTNSLIISGPASDIQTAGTLIEELDRPQDKDAREIHVVQLKTGDARQIAESLARLFTQQMIGKYGREVSTTNLRVEAEVASNSLIISASPGDWPTIQNILDQIKASIAPLTTPTARLVKLNNVKASDLATTLMQIYGSPVRPRVGYRSGLGAAGAGGPVPVPVNIAANDHTNSLLISAADDDHKAIAELIASMDVTSTQKVDPIRIVHVKSADAEKLAEQLKGLLPPSKGINAQPILIQADKLTNVVMIRASEGEQKMLEQLIGQLDQGMEDTARETRMINLKHASASQMVPMLLQLYQQNPAVRTKRFGEPAPAQEQIIIAAAPGDRSLVIDAPKKKIDEIASLVAGLDTDTSPITQQTRVYQLENTNAAQLAQSLSRLFATEHATGRYSQQVAAEPQPKFESDSGTNQLMIVATNAQFEKIEELIKKLQTAVTLASQTKTYKLEHAKAAEITPVLQAMLSEGPTGYRSRRPGGAGMGEGASVHADAVIRVAALATANAVVVQGPPAKLKLADELVKNFDTPDAAGSSSIHMISLKNAQAETVANTLKSLLPPPQRGQEQTTFIECDKLTNAILIRATEADRKMIAEMIAKIDSSTVDQAREMRIVKLEYASASALAQMLGQLYQNVAVAPRPSGRRALAAAPAAASADQADQVIITPAPHDKSLVIDAPRKKIEEIVRLVTSMDVKEAEGRLQMKTYQLTTSSAVELAQSLVRLFASERRGSRLGDAAGTAATTVKLLEPRFEADSATNQLMVAATIAQFEKIDDFIKKIQDATLQVSATKTFKLEFARSDDLADLLQTMLANATGPAVGMGRKGRVTSPAAELPVRVASMPASNSLVVQGPPERMTLAEELIKTFDTKEAAEGQAVIQIVQLKNAQAITLAEAVNASLARKGTALGAGKKRPSTPGAANDLVTVTPEVNSNSVLVRGPALDVPAAITMIKKLDEDSTAAAVQIHVVPIATGEAADLAKSLSRTFQEVFNQTAGRPRGSVSQPTFSITADERTNSLVISASPSHFAMIKEVLDQLAKAPEKPAREARPFFLQGADATQVVAKLEAMYAARKGAEKPFLEADTLTNTITAIAKDSDLLEIEGVISKLDDIAARQNVQVRVVPLTAVKAEKLAMVLQRIFPQMTDGQVVITDKLPPKPTIKDDSNSPSKGVLFPAPLVEDSTRGTRSAREKPIAVDAPAAPKPIAPEKTVTVVKPIKLASSHPASSPAGTSRPAETFVASARPAVTTPASSPASKPAEGIAQAASQPAESIERTVVTIAVDKVSNALIISGSRQDLDNMQTLIDQLTRSDATTDADFKVFKVTKADPQSVAQTLETLFNPHQKAQSQLAGRQRFPYTPYMPYSPYGAAQQGAASTPAQPSVVVVPDMRTRSVIVRAKLMDMDMIESMIQVLDQVSEIVSEIKIFSLKNTDATEVSNNLRDLLQTNSEEQGGDMYPGMGMGYYPGMGFMGGMSRRGASSRRGGNYYRQVFDLGGDEKIDPKGINISSNRLTNSVIVSAPSDIMKMVEKLIQELDQSTALAKLQAVRLYPLKNAEVRPTVTALQQVFTQSNAATGNTGGGSSLGGFGRRSSSGSFTPEGTIVITGDEAGRLIIVSAPSDKHDLISKVITEIDKAQGDDGMAIRIYKIQYADAVSVSSAVINTFGGAAGGTGRTGRGTPAIGAAGIRVSADSSSNAVVVKASKDDHEKISRLIDELDKSASQMKSPVVKLYPLKNAEVRTTVTALQQIFAVANTAARKGAQAGAQEPTPVISGDEVGKLIIVSAVAEKQELIAKVIEEVDRAQSNDPLVVKIYKIQNADAVSMATALMNTLGGSSGGAGGTVGKGSKGGAGAAGTSVNFRITGDASSNTLVVRASQEDHDKISKLVTEMDVLPIAAYPVQMIPLNNADPTNVAGILRSVFVSGVSAAGGKGRAGTGAAAQQGKGIVIEADRDTRMIMVRADDETFKKIRELVAKLDTVDAKGAVTQTVFPLKNAQAMTVASALMTAMAPPRGKTVNPDEQVTAVGEPMSNAVIVTANAANMQKVKDLLSKLDTEAEGGSRTEFIVLKNARATDLADALSKIASASSSRGTGAPRAGGKGGAAGGAFGQVVTISADTNSNALVMSGPSNDLERLMQMALKLDEAAALTGVTSVKLYPLQNADVMSTASALQQIFSQTARQGGRAGAAATTAKEAPVVVVGDEAGRNLVVSATAEKHDLIAKIIKDMDESQTADQVAVRVYKIQNADATTLATALTGTITGQGAGGKGLQGTPGAIRISADRSSNSLVVRAAVKDHDRLSKLIQEMDVSATTQFPVRLVPLNNAEATGVAQMLNRVFGSQTTGKGAATPGRGVTIEATADARVLAVRADDETYKKIRDLVAELDTAAPGSKATRTLIPLKNAAASSVALAMSQAFTPQKSQKLMPDDIVTVVAEPVSNSVIVTANEENLKKVRALLETMDKEDASGVRTEYVVLKNAKALDVASTLGKVVVQTGGAKTAGGKPPVSVSADAGSNALVMSGPGSDLNKLMKMAMELDKATAAAGTNVYILPLKNGVASVVADMIRNLYAQQATAARANKQSVDTLAVSSDDRSNAIVISTTKEMYDQVSQWVLQVEKMTASRGNLRLIMLDHADPTEVNNAIQQLFNQNSTGLPVRGGTTGGTSTPRVKGSHGGDKVETSVMTKQRSILLNASDEDYETIVKLAKVLDEAAANTRRMVKVVALKNATNTNVATAVTAHYRSIAMPNVPEDVVTVTALPQTTAVLVAAVKDRMDEVCHLVEELDKEQIAPQLEYRIYPLANATPSKIMPMLQQMLQQIKVLKPTEVINVQADDRTKSIIVTARGSTFDQVQKVIQSLDIAPTTPKVEVLIIPLRRGDAQQMATVLNDMLRPSATGQVTPEARSLQEQIRMLRIRSTVNDKVPDLDLNQPIKITADSAKPQGSNSLVISSTPENIRALQAIVEILDTVPVTEGVKVRILALKNADATSVATTLNQIFTQGQKLAGKTGSSVAGRAEPESVSGRGLVNTLNIAADMRTNTIIMSGLEETLALAEVICIDLDKVEGRFITEVRIFRLKYADAVKITPMLQAVFAESATSGGGAGAASAVAGAEGLRTQVTRLKTVLEKGNGNMTTQPKTRAPLTIQGDPSTNMLIVAARNDVMPLIADVVSTMDVAGAGSLNTVRIFPLDHADATRLQQVVTSLHTGPNAKLIRDEDKPTITVDTRTNALIIATSDKTFLVLESLLKKLDTAVPIDLRDIRMVTLKNADCATLATSIQKMMDARVQRLSTLGLKDSESLRAIIMPDSRSNSLIVEGSAESYDLVKGLAEQLDGANPALSGEIQLFPLKEANAGTLSTVLANLFTQRYAAVTSADVRRQKPVILGDLRSNSLLVSANQDDSKVLRNLLEKMDVKITDPAVQLTVIPMKFNDSGLVGTMIQQIFAARLKSMTPAGVPPAPQDSVDVRTDAVSNSLIISASKENLELIRGLLAKVDVEPPLENGLLKIYALKIADASNTASLLQNLVKQGLYKPGVAVAGNNPALAAREKVSIVSDIRTNTLIVSASKENLAIVEQIIRQMDSEAAALLSDIRVYALKHADATKIGPVLQQFYNQKEAGELKVNPQQKLMPMVVVSDPRTNSLLVAGGKENFASIEVMVKQLDTDQVAMLSDFRVFYLKQATAVTIQPVLQQLFNQRVIRTGVTKDPVTIIADQKTNSLIVGATPDDLKVAESLIAKLDTSPDGTKTHIYPLAKADATQVMNTLKQLLASQTGSTAGAGGAAAAAGLGISVDERMNAIVVSAGAGDVKRIEEIIKQLDTDSLARITEIRVFTLKNADATELATLLSQSLTNKPKPLTNASPNRQTLLQFVGKSKDGRDLTTSALQEGVLITADRRTNSLVVTGPKDNMPLLESLIQSMDSASPQMAQIRIFTLQNADAQRMAAVLMQLFRLQPSTGTSVASAGGAAAPRAVNYTMSTSQPTGGANSMSATVGTAEQYALSVTVDARTNSLLVGGTDYYVNLAGKVIEELDSSTAVDRRTEVYRLHNARASDIQTALQTFLDQERKWQTTILGADKIGAAQRMLEQEVAVVAVGIEGIAKNANTLLISASPRYFKILYDMIKELDQVPPQVLIQVLLAEVSLEDDSDVGVEWKYSNSFNGNKYAVGPTFGGSAQTGTLYPNNTGMSFSITGGDLAFFLRALQSQTRLQVLQRPQIIAEDNKQSILNIGQRRPFITNTRVTDAGNVLNTIEYQDVGVTLTVTPRISPDGFVRMDVIQKIEDINKSTVDIGNGVNAQVIDTRSATTTVTVQDGHTIVIGGTIVTKDNNVEEKVPLLGDIPLLGGLFKFNSTQRNRSELLIILTPHVVRTTSDSDMHTEKQVERINRYRGIMDMYRPGSEAAQAIDATSPLKTSTEMWKSLLPASATQPATQPSGVPLEDLTGKEPPPIDYKVPMGRE